MAGHTAGGIALLYRDGAAQAHLFSADSLFPDVETKVFNRLPDETWVYPGHGNDTTLGSERPSLPEWRARGW